MENLVFSDFFARQSIIFRSRAAFEDTMIKIQTKRTFLNFEISGEEQIIGHSRARSFSCPPVFDISTHDTDSLSSAPTLTTTSTKVGSKRFDVSPNVSNSSVVIARNLPIGMTIEAFKLLLPTIGFCIDFQDMCSFFLVHEGPNKASMFIHLSEPGVAMSLFHLLHGITIGERTIVAFLDPDEDPAKPVNRDPTSHGAIAGPQNIRGKQHDRKIFIGGLNPNSTTSDIRMYFGRFGSIKDCGIVKDFRGISRKFGFCEFWSPESVDAVMSAPSHVINHRVVGVRPYSLRE
jgi:hypothetical protein